MDQPRRWTHFPEDDGELTEFSAEIDRLAPVHSQHEEAANLLKNVPREIAAAILMGGAHLYGFTESHFAKADAAAARRRP